MLLFGRLISKTSAPRSTETTRGATSDVCLVFGVEKLEGKEKSRVDMYKKHDTAEWYAVRLQNKLGSRLSAESVLDRVEGASWVMYTRKDLEMSNNTVLRR